MKDATPFKVVVVVSAYFIFFYCLMFTSLLHFARR